MSFVCTGGRNRGLGWVDGGRGHFIRVNMDPGRLAENQRYVRGKGGDTGEVPARVPLAEIGNAMREACRRLGRSGKTAYLYVGWARRYVMFHHGRHPGDLDARDVRSFVSGWSRSHTRLSGATLNQALHALVFLYAHVLHTPLPPSSLALLRHKRRKRLPQPVQRETIDAFLGQLHGVPRLVALLQLGCGLRLTEAVQLRLADLRLAEAYLVVGGSHAREIPIPALLLDPLHRYVQDRLSEGRNHTHADAYLFVGQRKRHVDGELPMKPLPAVNIRRAFRAVQPCVAPHALRQCYAIGELDRGVNLLVVHQRLGQRDLHTTLAYQSLSTRGPASVPSPADQLTEPEQPPPRLLPLPPPLPPPAWSAG